MAFFLLSFSTDGSAMLLESDGILISTGNTEFIVFLMPLINFDEDEICQQSA